MRKLFYLLTLTIPLTLSAQKKNAPEPPDTMRATVLKVADVYVAPDADSQKVSVVMPGHEVVVTERSGPWVKGFTSDPDILRAAVDKTRGKSSQILADPVSGLPGESLSDQLTDSGIPNVAQVAANLASFEAQNQSFQDQLRAQYTLEGMANLARYLDNIPGRKNLIWFSGSFPISILPDGDLDDPFVAVASSEDEYRKTVNQLARAQVAVYPVDARGLQTLPVFDASNSGRQYARNPGAFAKDSQKFFEQNTNEQDTMRRMAEDTGGQAFYNTNDLSTAVRKAIDNGSNYYTLSYTPTNTKWQGDYRKIKVNLEAQGYTLSYRRGYYADDPNSPGSVLRTVKAATPAHPAPPRPSGPTLRPTSAMLIAMGHGLPQPAQILFKVRVIPAYATDEPTVAEGNLIGAPNFAPVKGPFRRYLVDFAAVADQIGFATTPDGKYRAVLEFVSIVYDPTGRAAVVQTNQVEVVLSPARYAEVRRIGLPFHQEISAPVNGSWTIRTGIHDARTDHVAAVELPVAAIKKIPPPTPPSPATPQPSN